MFFIGGILQKEKLLNFYQLFTCPNCKQLTSIKVIMTYSYFHFFFIPIFSWNKRYFIQCENCGSYSEISKDVGKQIEKGIDVRIDESYYHFSTKHKQCSTCGYTTQENFEYCPKCGNKL